MLALFLAASLALPSSPWDVHLGSGQHALVKAEQPFEAAALSWSAAGELAVQVRASDDGQEWSDWIPLALDDDLTDPSAGRYLTAITHFGASERYLQYSFSGTVDRLTVTMFPPSVAAGFGRPGGLKPSPRQNLGPIPIRSRLDWGCPDGESSPLWTPAHTTVTHAVVHHTAGANTLPDWDAELRNIWYFHTFTNGWGDIGYNYLIDPDGVIYEGRAGGEGIIGAHFSCRNTNTVGIALLGTYSTASPTPAALQSLEQLLAEICRRNAIVPGVFAFHAPTGLLLPTILGHRDGNPSTVTCSKTECPGDVLYALLPAIRSELAPAVPRRRVVRP